MPDVVYNFDLPFRHRILQGGCSFSVLCALLLAGCGKQETKPAVGVLAKGDGWVVRVEDFRHWWGSRPGPLDSSQARTDVLDRLVERASIAQTARQAGLERDPETASQIDAILITRLQETQLAPQLDAVKVPDDEVRARYDALRDTAYTQPEALRVALLWFNTLGQEPLVERYRPRLEQIRVQVGAGGEKFPPAAGFGPLAVGNTEHRPSRLLGGDLGWLNLTAGNDPWLQKVLDLAAPLKHPGDLSLIEAGKDGLFLVRLIERRASTVRPFESVSDEIRKGLVEQRRNALRDEFTRRILSQSKVERFPDALQSLQELPPRGGAQPISLPQSQLLKATEVSNGAHFKPSSK